MSSVLTQSQKLSSKPWIMRLVPFELKILLWMEVCRSLAFELEMKRGTTLLWIINYFQCVPALVWAREISQDLILLILLQDPFEAKADSVTTYPYIAAPPLYVPPSSASIVGIIGETSLPSTLRKSYTSGDELDELNSPMASILLERPQSSPLVAKPGWTSKESRSHWNALRYGLLRDVWLNSE